MKQDILVPFDGSANAREALRVAIDMAKAFKEKMFFSMFSRVSRHRIPNDFFSQAQIDDYRSKWLARHCSRVRTF